MILTKENISSIELLGLIDKKIKSTQTNELLIIVPTNRKLRAVKKEIIDISPGQTVAKINIETLGTLSQKLLETIEFYIQLSESASSVLIKNAAERVKLKYFVNYRGSIPNGTLDRIKNVISEYKRHGITPEKLISETEKLEASEKIKAEDIAEIYFNYKKLTAKINALEIGDVYEKLLENDFSNSFYQNYVEVKNIVLLGFDQFSIPEIKIINKLSEIVENKLYIDFDYYKSNSLLFSHLEETYTLLEQYGFIKINDNSVYEFNEFIKIVRERLFLNIQKKSVSKFKNDISIIKGRYTEEEIELIAKKIKTLLIKNRVKPHKICVVFNLISDFSPLVRDVFERFGIPYNLTDRTSLDQSSSIIAIINLLEIAENDYYYKNIFRALSGRFLSSLNVDAVNLNLVASKLKIVSGYQKWVRSIESEIENNTDDDEKINEEKLRQALNDLLKIEEVLKPFKQKLTPSEFYKILLKFITKSNLSLSVLEGHPDYREEDIASLTTFTETIEEILILIEKENNKEKKYSLSFYLDQIKTACSWARFNIKGRSDYGVLITSIDEIRGLSFDYLFLAGMNDGIFPTRYKPEIFFSGSFMKKESIHQTEERYHFYQALSAWRKQLYLSYSAINDDRELVESNFLKDFSNLFETSEITSNSFEKIAFSEEEIQMILGRQIALDLESDVIFKSRNIDNRSLKRKIEVSKQRINSPHEEFPFNGFVGLNGKEEIKNSLKKFADREYSITQLETYSRCPFKYFMQYVLGVSEISEPTEEVEPVEIGSIMHKILFEFYTELRTRKIILHNCSETDFKKAEKIIFDIAEQNINSPIFYSELSFYEKEKITGINGNRKESILYKFLLKERESNNSSEPTYFEIAFGNIKSKIKDETLSSEEPVLGNSIKFRGKVDRIDVDTENETFDIVDYKLSLRSKPTQNDIQDGISLQLPLYLFAAKKLFEKNEITLTPSEVYLYSLKYNEKEFGKNRIALIDRKSENKKEEIGKLFEKTLNKIEQFIERIIKGEFPLTSLKDREKKICGYCDYRKICRIDETDL